MNYISILKGNTKIWKWYKNDTYAPVQKPNYAQLRSTNAQLRPTDAQLRPTDAQLTPNYIQPPTVGHTNGPGWWCRLLK